jgi:hypothetical protein
MTPLQRALLSATRSGWTSEAHVPDDYDEPVFVWTDTRLRRFVITSRSE